MRDPAESLITAYSLCLQGKISINGAIVPVYFQGVPMGTQTPYIAIAELTITPDVQGAAFGALSCSTLIDIVTKYDTELIKFSEAMRIGGLVMQLTDREDLNAHINSGVTLYNSAEDPIQLMTPLGESHNLTVKWDINRHRLETSMNMLEDIEGIKYYRRLIRLRDIIYQTTLI